MKKNHLLLGISLLAFSGAMSQLNIQSGATFFVQSGATVTVQGDITSNADIQGPGTVLLKGSALQTVNMNGFSIQNVQVDNANNIALGGIAKIGTSLAFLNGKVQLNNFNLILESPATISGFDNTKFVVTNGTGKLQKNALGASAFTFPIGFSATTYNPATITQNGTADDIAVRSLSNVLQNGSSGLPFIKEVVDASWDISETVAGGSNLNITSQWAGSDELPGFNRNKAGISYYNGTSWDLTTAAAGVASGSNPYTYTRSNVSNLGFFAVGYRPVFLPLKISLKVLLQGPYAAGLMGDGLRTAGVIPTLEPYSAMAQFTHAGTGGGETVQSSAFAATGTPANDIVDWVFLQLHDGANPATIVATRSALVQRDGDVVQDDGTGTLQPWADFGVQPDGNYYVSVRHRNHLGVRSAGTIFLSSSSTASYNFTTAQSQAYAGAVLNTPMVALPGGLFGMWAGNANANNNVRYSGLANDNNVLLNTILGGDKTIVISNVYSLGDFNMNANVRYSGLANDNNILLNIVLGGDKTIVINQPF